RLIPHWTRLLFDLVRDEDQNVEYLRLDDDRILGKSFNEVSQLISAQGALSEFRFAGLTRVANTVNRLLPNGEGGLLATGGDVFQQNIDFGDFFNFFGATDLLSTSFKNDSTAFTGDFDQGFQVVLSFRDNLAQGEQDEVVHHLLNTGRFGPAFSSFLVRDIPAAVPSPSSLALFATGLIWLRLRKTQTQ
ncbi:MAG: hypothetical protein HOM11_12695, partial [Methylococcales bacterium]|nr:hypothetical protein [Methylococcales bacterium]